MSSREFDFDNCEIDSILDFARRNYKRNNEEIDKKRDALNEQISEENAKDDKFNTTGPCELNC